MGATKDEVPPHNCQLFGAVIKLRNTWSGGRSRRSIKRFLIIFTLAGLFAYSLTGLLPASESDVSDDYLYLRFFDMDSFNAMKTSADDPKLVEAFRKWFLDTPNNKPYNLSNPKQVSSAWGNRQLPEIEALPKGFFIECGGYDGETLSNTLYLERMLGWEGLLIEADPESYAKLQSKNRKAWSSNTCLSVENYPAEAKLFQNSENPEVNGLTYRTYHGLNSTIHSQCFPLYTMLLALNRSVVDFFSLDVEGAELDILKTIPFDKITVKFLLVEVVNIRDPGDNSPQYQGGNPKGAMRMAKFMKSKGFKLHAKVPMGAGNDLLFKYIGESDRR